MNDNVVSLDSARRAKRKRAHPEEDTRLLHHGQPRRADESLLDPETAAAIYAPIEYGRCRCEAICTCPDTA